MRYPLVLSVLFAGVGCGDEPKPVAIEDLAVELSKAVCHQFFECCGGVPGAPFVTSEEGCANVAAPMISSQYLSASKNSVPAGRIAYDGDAARKCLDFFAKMSCSDLSSHSIPSILGECDPIFEPLVEVAGACHYSDDCVSGFYCNDGSCVATVGAGTACSGSSQCSGGLYCDETTDICKPQEADGATCSGDDACVNGSCEDDVCGSRAFCAGLF